MSKAKALLLALVVVAIGGWAAPAIQKLGTDNQFAVDATEDAGAFTDANLAQYKVVIAVLVNRSSGGTR